MVPIFPTIKRKHGFAIQQNSNFDNAAILIIKAHGLKEGKTRRKEMSSKLNGHTQCQMRCITKIHSIT